jgi:8-oxo-dGTP diphosphatase
VPDARSYPQRPFLAVSAAVIDGDRVLVVRRARPPALGVYTLPGGVVEAGETLEQAAAREVLEETGLAITIVGPAGFRETIARDTEDRVERHFVILCFAATLAGGTLALNEELSEAHWLLPADLADLQTTPGLADIVAAAYTLLAWPVAASPLTAPSFRRFEP